MKGRINSPEKWEPNMEEQAERIKKAYNLDTQKQDNVVEGTKAATDPMIFDKNSPYYEAPKNQPIDPMNFDVPVKSIEEKIYIVLMVQDGDYALDDPDYNGYFKICHGRTQCYRFIQEQIESYARELNPHESKVITQTIQTETDTGNTKYYMTDIETALSVYAFCKAVESYYGDTAFDIDMYYPALVSDKNPNIQDSTDNPVDDDAVAREYLKLTANQRKKVIDPMLIEGQDAALIIKENANRFNKQEHYNIPDDFFSGEGNV